MIRRILFTGAAGITMLAAQAYGQQYPQQQQQQYPPQQQQYPQNDRYDNQQDRYDRNDGRYDERSRARRGDVFESVQADLQQATQFSRRGGDQNYFNSAFSHLDRFREGMARGEFRRGELDRVIEATQNVARRGGIPPELRSVLYRDVSMMREYRARMAQGQGGYRDGYDRNRY